MNLKWKNIFSVFLATPILFSCIKKQTYSDTPTIEYKAFNPYPGDSADFIIKFNDGNGDIGVSAGDTTKSLFVNYYYQDTVTGHYVGYYSSILNDTLKSGYIVKKPNDSYQGKPISGEISVRLQQYRHSKKIKHIKYVSYLIDQAGHKSNVITTPEIIVP